MTEVIHALSSLDLPLTFLVIGKCAPNFAAALCQISAEVREWYVIKNNDK